VGARAYLGHAPRARQPTDRRFEQSFEPLLEVTVAYVYWVIGIAQVAFVVLAIALEYASASRDRAATIARPLDGAASRTAPALAAALRGARSPLWWRRFAAARALAQVADASDRELLLKLLGDAHPAVQSAASESLRRYADPELIRRVIDGLSSASSAVRAHQLTVLGGHAEVAAPMLLDRIRDDAPAHKLYAYINAAAALDDPACMARVADLSTHPHGEVRVVVARVLRGRPGEVAHVKLLSMLRDPDWRVRAQAARGLGAMRDDRSVDALLRAIADPTWWVRFRAGLALAGMGDVGNEALSRALEHQDRYARDMAALVRGLSAASLAELSAG